MRKRPSRHGLKMVIGIMAIVMITGLGLYHTGASSQEVAKKTVRSETPPPEPTKPTITEAQMAEQINKIIAANPDVDISVSIGDPKNGAIVHYGTDAVYEAASVAKVLTGVFYLHNVEKGDLSLDKRIGNSTAKHYLQIMIEQSDNTAWKTLNDIVNRDRLKAYANSIGFKHYDYTNNTFTSTDITHLLVQLQQGKLLNYDHTQLILEHMKNASRREYLAPALPT